TLSIFAGLPIVALAVLLWPVLGTSYIGLPIDAARLITIVGFALCVFAFERTLVGGFQFLTRTTTPLEAAEFTPTVTRRAFALSAIGVVLAGGAITLARRLYRVATFSYDGLQYKGRVVEPVTPNEQFYC